MQLDTRQSLATTVADELSKLKESIKDSHSSSSFASCQSASFEVPVSLIDITVNSAVFS